MAQNLQNKALSKQQRNLLAQLQETDCTRFDFFAIKKAIMMVSRISEDSKRERHIQRIDQMLLDAKVRYQQRLASLQSLSISYPDLPVSAKKEQILTALDKHQVVIVAGETGSGKTTQLPKICAELGRGVKGRIGHTQPRRIAARSVAERIASELGVELGQAVGFEVRFSDQINDNTLIKLMTDGIVLSEISSDPFLNAYDTLIIDEAHERSLNNDFLIGYLKKILPKRPDLKVIITSATIDVERFSRHFDNAPIISVSGRSYEVEIRYRPLKDDDSGDYMNRLVESVYELKHEGRGDILIFVSGEQEIRDCVSELNKEQLFNTEILPLYARLNASDQQKIFQPSDHEDRIIIATNVAETSLTIPNIRYVIDTGFARISRYSIKTKVQRLPIEPISKASANQRAGRCGRVANGICIRLYSEEDFNNRADFTEPEILRTNLSSVILQMTALNISDIEHFPFLEKPDLKQIKDGIKLLDDLQAIEPTAKGRRLTRTGKMLAKLPLDPRLGAMIIEGSKRNALAEILIIVSFLSIVDPRERPHEHKQSSDDKHHRFYDKNSDFITILNLYRYLKTQQHNLSNSRFRKLCKSDYINAVRVREWQDIITQLSTVCRELSLRFNSEDASYEHIHTALIAGLFAYIGEKKPDEPRYQGARNSSFYLFPSSTLFKLQPKWVVSGEIIETSKLWARINAKIEPQWVLSVAGHLCKSSYSTPRYEKKTGTIVADEKVMLYGLTLIAARKVNFASIDKKLSREIFIQTALVEGNISKKPPFLIHNQQKINEILAMEDKTRRRDILVDEQHMFDFYDQNVGQEVVSDVHLHSWYNQAVKKDAKLLHFDTAFLMRDESEKISAKDFPNYWQQGEIRLALKYHFDVGGERDGVSLMIPLALLNQIHNHGFDWHIAGMRAELITSLIKSLPKSLRRNFVPVPNFVKAFLERVSPYQKPLLETLAHELYRMTGVTIGDNWDLDKIDPHLKIRFEVIDDKGKTIASSYDLEALKDELKGQAVAFLSEITAQSIERTGMISWDCGDLPSVFEHRERHFTVKGYPALCDEKISVGVKLFDNESDQKVAMRQGLRRLLWLTIPSPISFLQQKLPNKAKLAMYFAPFGNAQLMIDDCIVAAIDALMKDYGQAVGNQQDFANMRQFVATRLNEKTENIAIAVENILTLAFTINKTLKGSVGLDRAFAMSDIKQQLSQLIYPHFVTETGDNSLADTLRYLRSIEYRLEKLRIDPNSDRLKMLKVEVAEKAYQQLLQKFPKNRPLNDDVIAIKQMIFELRVSLFAQPLGTQYPISEKRIMQAIAEIKL